MKITIVGGGNIGTQFAVHCSQKNDVIVFTSKPETFCETVSIVDENGNEVLESKKIKATNNQDEAFLSADLIFITYPAPFMENISKKLCKYSKPGLKIGLVPGTGGGECAFKDLIKSGVTVFGLQRVPSVARLVERGKAVRAVGYRNELFVASLPGNEACFIADTIQDIFGIKCTPLPNYLSVTLTPSNPILHTARLKTVFKDYKCGVKYSSLPLFYEDWDDESGELLFKCDAEVQNICKALCSRGFDVSGVKSLKEHYESDTPSALTNKIRSIKGFKGLTSPAIKSDDKYIPDFNARYFSADFPYGLNVLIQIGDFLGIDIENMKETMDWYRKVSGNTSEFSYKKYGINNLSDFLDFYSK
ncbi:MAG: NAD/NADP octopine/nopaline dehydrogenase family protein [Clostridia bacterium]|nr:NAD/NADP octopine/nopaline dehydrogenase family protein [Clostridia bacterium]